MKHKLTALLFTVVALVAPVVASSAYSPQAVVFDPNNNVERNTGLGNATPGDVAAGVINWILGILMLLALALMVYAGVLWMTSRGNEETVTKAKNIMIGALIGAFIILASYGITLYVFNNLIDITNA